MQSLFNVEGIPSENQLRNIVDEIAPSSVNPVFNNTLRVAQCSGVVDEYRILDGGVLLAIDGIWYFSSQKIHCEHCLTKKVKDKDGEELTIYYHAALAGTLVKPGSNKVLPVAPEIIRNEDGEKKQDCEINAVKRWFDAHYEEYKWLKPTLLGDDLYSRRPFCEEVTQKGFSFIFTCKEESHQWLMETVKNSELREILDKKWDPRKKKQVHYAWKYLNGVPIRYDERNPFLVNYFSYEIKPEGAKKPSYFNSWVTNKPITDMNVAYLAECGRA